MKKNIEEMERQQKKNTRKNLNKSIPSRKSKTKKKREVQENKSRTKHLLRK